MDVNKTVLEKMSSKELETYIKPESRFVPEAIEYAFEILKARGYEFSEADLERWNALKQKKVQSLQEAGSDYKKTINSCLWYVSLVLGFIIVFGPFFGIFLKIFVFLILSGIGYLIRKGYNWVKYVLLAVTIFEALLMFLIFKLMLTIIH